MSSLEAGPAVVGALSLDVDRLVGAEPAVRADHDDSIHQMRVATRRIRSVLRSYRSVFERAEIDEIRLELKWLAGILGVARDAEVMAQRYESLIADEPPERIVGPISARLVEAQRARYAAAHAEVIEALDESRYAQLRERLSAILEDPPLSSKAGKPAAKLFTKALAKEYRRVRHDVRVEFSAGSDERVIALHDVRKSAKRLRYAGEAAHAVLGDSADHVAGEAKALQSVLGDHRDAVESQQLIVTETEAARLADEDTFTYGLLYMAEEQNGQRALAGYHPALESLTVACSALGK